MLKLIRNSTIGIILTIIFGISLFLIKGGNKYSGILGVGANDVAAVGDIKISNKRFVRSFDLTKNNFNELTRSNLNNNEAKMIGLDQQAINSLINEALFLNEYNSKKLFVDDTIIARKIKDYIPGIYDENNNIIEQNLNSFLYNQNLNLEELVNIIRIEILNNFYNNSLINNINYPNSSYDKIYLYENHIRNIEYLIIPNNKINISIVEDQKSIEKYYNDNINLFTDPEKRTIEYIYLNPNNYFNFFEASYNEINEYYNNNIEEFTEKEKRTFLQLNFISEEEANNFYLKNKNISNYEKLKIIAIDNNIKFNEYKLIDKNDILSDISNIVFNINKNKISEIIISPIAYHLIFVKNIRQKKITNFENSKKDIALKIKEYKSEEYIQELLEYIDEDILNNLSLSEIAKKNELKILTIFEAILNNRNNNALENKIVQESFKEHLNITSDLNKGIEENSFFLFNVSNIIQPKKIDLKKIFPEVSKKWKVKETETKINDYAENLIKNNDDLIINNLSKQYNENIYNKSIDKKNYDLPKNFVHKIFNTDIKTPIFFYHKNDLFFGKVKSIEIVKNNNIIDPSTTINNDLSNELKNIILNNIAKNVPIKINNNLIDMLISNM